MMREGKDGANPSNIIQNNHGPNSPKHRLWELGNLLGKRLKLEIEKLENYRFQQKFNRFEFGLRS